MILVEPDFDHLRPLNHELIDQAYWPPGNLSHSLTVWCDAPES